MTDPRSDERHTKVRRQKKYYGVVSTKGSAAAVAGRTAYREEYQRDYGPDLDEPLDGTEFAQEI
jgi:hypothetical protein